MNLCYLCKWWACW